MSDVAVPQTDSAASTLGVRPDTTDMVAVHRVFRDAVAAAPMIIGGASNADVPHAENVATYYANVLAFLEVHHQGEDLLLWPKLLERAPEAAAGIGQVADQHDGVTEQMAVVEQALEIWWERPDTDHGAKLAGALALLGAELMPHLDQEEELVLPLIESHLTLEEYAELPAHGMQNFRGEIWLLLGLLLDAMPPVARAGMLEHMPPPVAAFWVNEGSATYEAFIADVRR
jgi:hemerythrin-like domain-containing protein